MSQRVHYRSSIAVAATTSGIKARAARAPSVKCSTIEKDRHVADRVL